MLSCKHSKFTLPGGITFLNCAYMSPLLWKVEKAGIRGIRHKRNPTSVLPQDFFRESDALRIAFAKLINAEDSNRIVIIPSVSYGMATVAANLPLRAEQNIIVASEQFPSNYYVWKKRCDQGNADIHIITPPDTLVNRGASWNTRILESINDKTAAVAISHFHWTDGTRFDLMAIRKRTREVGAMLIIDGTQSVGAFPFDVALIQPDALICAGYKWLLGPYSIGLAYYGEAFDNGSPIEENWINRLHSDEFAKLVNYQDSYQPGALRFEVGEHSNFILVPMMLKALEQINRWGPAGIQEYCGSITAKQITRLKEHGFWVEEENARGHHLFGIRLPSSKDVEVLKSKLLQRKIYVSFRGDAIRVSPNVYNREEDMERLVNALIS